MQTKIWEHTEFRNMFNCFREGGSQFVWRTTCDRPAQFGVAQTSSECLTSEIFNYLLSCEGACTKHYYIKIARRLDRLQEDT